MNESLSILLENYFNESKTLIYTEVNQLLLSYGYDEHLEQVEELINSPIAEDSFNAPFEIEAIFNKACHDILIKMFIVPMDSDLLMYHKLLTALYKLENSLDSKMVIEIIEDSVHLENPKDTLVALLEQVCDLDWAFLINSIREVRVTLIDSLKQVHNSKIQDEADRDNQELSLMDETRVNTIRNFFNSNPQSLTFNMVTSGYLSIPVDDDVVLPKMASILTNLTDEPTIAAELIAMALITPIKLTSVNAQAKVFNNKLFADPRVIMNISTNIDILTRDIK